MSNRVEIPKVVAYAQTGQEDALKLTKCVAYFILEPGDEGEAPNRQAHVHAQIVRRS